MSHAHGAVACGHPDTRDAAAAMLRAGGNAFDAVAAGLWMACVAEPVLASPGGGGFLLAQPAGESPRLYDFFAQTPRQRLPLDEVDFHPIHADFGTTVQEFHIGVGAAATPGMVAGLFALQQELGRMPRREPLEPAIAAARHGVTINDLQGYICSVVAPILRATPEARALFARADGVLAAGDQHAPRELGDCLDALAHEGPDLFYRGEIAASIAEACTARGGHLRREDFTRYRVERRQPLALDYRGYRLLTNPPPAAGGLLVAFGLAVLAESRSPADPAGAEAALRLGRALAATGEARMREGLDAGVDAALARHLLAPATVEHYRSWIAAHPPAYRGTTHISVIDAQGNAAAATVSNGEGCGWMVPGTGMMLNNMLGEADLLPRGFASWSTDQRLSSMMAPTLVEEAGGDWLLAIGSGGSNRIRSALLQVLAARLDAGLPLAAAVEQPRLHLEGERLEIEGGFGDEAVAALRAAWPEHCVWPDRNMFFGGAHAVESGPRGFAGAGDPRRGGVADII